jgi:hypothetical protein
VIVDSQNTGAILFLRRLLIEKAAMTMPNVSLDKPPDVSAFFDAQSNTISYVIKDPDSTSCAIIDAVMQFDYAAGRLSCAH